MAYADRSALVGDGSTVTRVIFFDIDGTLVSSKRDANTVHKDAFGHAFAEVYGFTGSVEEIAHQGMTDMWIIEEICLLHGIPAPVIMERMPAATASMVKYCNDRRDQIGVSLLPGVVELLTPLSANGSVLLGLVTGNLEEIGLAKIEASGMTGFFSFGGFGSDHVSRAELIRIGLRRAAARYPGLRLDSALVYHVGDTLHDMKAAREAGVRGIGVATGGSTFEALTACEWKPHVVFHDMSDTAAVLAALEM